jgi:hypothetical protein
MHVVHSPGGIDGYNLTNRKGGRAYAQSFGLHGGLRAVVHLDSVDADTAERGNRTHNAGAVNSGAA